MRLRWKYFRKKSREAIEGLGEQFVGAYTVVCIRTGRVIPTS